MPALRDKFCVSLLLIFTETQTLSVFHAFNSQLPEKCGDNEWTGWKKKKNKKINKKEKSKVLP